MAERLQLLSIGSHARLGAAVMQTKFVRDVENIELFLQASSPVIAVSTSILVGSLVVTAIQVPEFLVVYLLTVPLGVALVVRMRKRAGLRNEEFRREVESLAFSLSEMSGQNELIRAHALETQATAQLANSTESVRRAGLALDRVNSRFESASWVSFNALSIICLGLAAWASITKTIPISTGQVVLLGTYFAILTTGVSNLVGLMPIIAKGVESMKSINELFRDPDLEQNVGKPKFKDVSGAISFRGLSYTYPGANEPALNNFSLEIGAGQTVALIGPSGSGKSTAASLILGFVRPEVGSLLIDGIDSTAMDMRSFRSQVSVVLQEPKIMSATVRENVEFGLEPRPDDAPINEALANANAVDFVSQLPAGLNTVIGPKGVQLSGGQKQRIAIARALIRKPRVLILDEATSALDGHSEVAVQEALKTLIRGRTCIVIAHRLSTVRNADVIVVLEAGSVVEVGNHDQLLERRGAYFSLLNQKPEL